MSHVWVARALSFSGELPSWTPSIFAPSGPIARDQPLGPSVLSVQLYLLGQVSCQKLTSSYN